MSKTKDYAITTAIIAAGGAFLHNIVEQSNRVNSNPNIKFDSGELLGKTVLCGLAGGAGGAAVGAFVDNFNDSIEPIDTDAYLRSLVNKIKANPKSRINQFATRKCNKIICLIQKEFGHYIVGSPEIKGSIAKHTAIKGKSDFDIHIRFSKDSFTIEEMFQQLKDYLDNNVEGLNEKVREQGKSLGLLFKAYSEDIKIDIVPGRLLSDNPKKTSVNLRVKPDSFLSKPSYTKTDTKVQESLKLTPTQKDLVMILKKWKADRDLSISSYMIELFVIKCFAKKSSTIPTKLTDKLLMVLRYIESHIDRSPLISLENSNNKVNTLTDSQRDEVKREIQRILEDYEYQPNSICEHFHAD